MTLINYPNVTGDTIRKLRVLKGINQKTAAYNLGITQQAFSKIEMSAVITENKIASLLKSLSSSEDDLKTVLAFTPHKP
jgi:transcriptional regulator with XRE-family HTH domain